jgi:hypothetical protein
MAYPTWPADLLPNRAEWALVNNTQVFQSALSGDEQTLALPGSRWVANLTFSRVNGLASDKARRLRAFLAALGGRAGRFYLPVHDALAPAGSALGTPLIAKYGQTGTSLATKGWTPNQAGVLLAGDYVQYGNELNMLAADAAADADGKATLTLVRPIRTSPLVGDALVVSSPCALMALVDDEQARWAAQAPVVYAVSFACREVLNG